MPSLGSLSLETLGEWHERRVPEEERGEGDEQPGDEQRGSRRPHDAFNPSVHVSGASIRPLALPELAEAMGSLS